VVPPPGPSTLNLQLSTSPPALNQLEVLAARDVLAETTLLTKPACRSRMPPMRPSGPLEQPIRQGTSGQTYCWAYTLSSLMSIPAKSRVVSTGGSHPTVSSRAQRMAHSMPYAMRCSAGSLDVSTSRRSSLSRRLMVRSDGPTRRSRQQPPRLVFFFVLANLVVTVSFLSLGPASVPDLWRSAA
jgi:hypothetical protein